MKTFLQTKYYLCMVVCVCVAILFCFFASKTSQSLYDFAFQKVVMLQDSNEIAN